MSARLPSLRDAPNTSREYETIYILRPNTANDGVADVNTRVKNVIEGMGGKVLKVDNWGKRRLAYEVAKERKGIYLYWRYLATSGVVEEAERNLRMLDAVIRYMTVKLDESIDPEARPSELDDSSFERAATTAADEEDLFLSRAGEEGEGEGEDDDGEFRAASEGEGEASEAEPSEGEASAAEGGDQGEEASPADDQQEED